MFYISYSLVIILHMSSWYSTVHYTKGEGRQYMRYFLHFFIYLLSNLFCPVYSFVCLSRLQYCLFVPSTGLFVSHVYSFVCLSRLQFCLFVPSTVLFVCSVYSFVCLSRLQFCLSRLPGYGAYHAKIESMWSYDSI